MEEGRGAKSAILQFTSQNYQFESVVDLACSTSPSWRKLVKSFRNNLWVQYSDTIEVTRMQLDLLQVKKWLTYLNFWYSVAFSSC